MDVISELTVNITQLVLFFLITTRSTRFTAIDQINQILVGQNSTNAPKEHFFGLKPPSGSDNNDRKFIMDTLIDSEAVILSVRQLPLALTPLLTDEYFLCKQGFLF